MNIKSQFQNIIKQALELSLTLEYKHTEEITEIQFYIDLLSKENTLKLLPLKYLELALGTINLYAKAYKKL